MDSREPLAPDDYWHAAALLGWQVELGATEAIGETPLNRYDLPATLPRPATLPGPANPPGPVGPLPAALPGREHSGIGSAPRPVQNDPSRAAGVAAAGAASLDALRAAMADFDGCDLKKGARNLVFADGDPGARVMVIGEAPGREEDACGLPFVGRAGQLLDRMFAAIGLARTTPGAGGLYIANILPWQPPGNRDPSADEIATMLPFLHRHVELADPDILILMGNVSCQALLGVKGITRLRGSWTGALDRPALPMFHPAYLLRNPAAKREAWADLLMLRARLTS